MSLQFDSPLQILLSIEKVFYHDLKNNVKDLAQTGLLILYTGKIKDRQVLSIRIGHLIMNLIDELVIVKCEYESVVTYFFVVVSQDHVSSITFDKSHQERAKLQNYLRTHCKTLEVEDLDSNREVNDTIDKHWTGFLIKPVAVPDKVQEFISTAGTTMEKGFIKLSLKVRDYYEKNKKKQEAPNPRNIEIEPQVQYTQYVGQVNQGNAAPQQVQPDDQPQPSKFKKFLSAVKIGLQKTSKVFTKVSTPIVKKGRQLNDKVCCKIDQSENKVLKYMKDFAAVTNDALSNAYSGIKTGVTNKQTLFVTFFSKDAVINNPQIEENQQVVFENTEEVTPVQIDVSNRGLKDSLLNKGQFEENIETPYEERI